MNIFTKQGPRTYRILRGWYSKLVESFEWSVQEPIKAQQKVLNKLITQSKNTKFGRDHSLSNISTFSDFRDAIPVRDFDQLSPWLGSVIAGKQNILTNESVLSFVETSGTQSSPKLIPVTKSWSRHIKDAQTLWILGVLKDYPMIDQGDVLHFVSKANEYNTPTGLTVGANTGRMVKALPSMFQKRFVLHGLPDLPQDQDLQQYVHLRLSLDRVVTGWMTANPSTIALYARKFTSYQDWLAEDLYNGTMRQGPARNLPSNIRDELERRIHSRPVPLSWELAHTWPLAMIGCWTGGPAQYFIEQFPRLLGAKIPVRDVGITASEGYYAIPLDSSWDGGVLWNEGELLEFENAKGQMFWGWELEMGKQYSLITSSVNGLLRYRLQDLVEVTGFYKNTPIIRFVGKHGRYLNATGEKVTEAQLSLAVVRADICCIGFTGFTLLDDVPYIEVAIEFVEDKQSSDLHHQLDHELQNISVEYRSKRSSQRIGPLQIRELSKGTYERFRGYRISKGATASQVKDCVIAKDEQEWNVILALSI